MASALSGAVRRSTACMSGSAAPISTARGPNPGTTSVVPRSTSNASAWTGPSMYTRCTMLLISLRERRTRRGGWLPRVVPVGGLEDVYDARPGLEARAVFRARGDVVGVARLVGFGRTVHA